MLRTFHHTCVQYMTFQTRQASIYEFQWEVYISFSYWYKINSTNNWVRAQTDNSLSYNKKFPVKTKLLIKNWIRDEDEIIWNLHKFHRTLHFEALAVINAPVTKNTFYEHHTVQYPLVSIQFNSIQWKPVGWRPMGEFFIRTEAKIFNDYNMQQQNSSNGLYTVYEAMLIVKKRRSIYGFDSVSQIIKTVSLFQTIKLTRSFNGNKIK